jgi:hypothetical protein
MEAAEKNLAWAKSRVSDLLSSVDGDANAVYENLVQREAAERTYDWFTEKHAETWTLLRLALADVTGNPDYRM